MTPERWQQVRKVFDQAVSLQVAERLSYLDKTCSSDPELRREVESLLQAEARAGSRFLNAPAVQLKSDGVADQRPTRVGRRIGAYTILEEIGHGGMGEVYRAVRADGQYTKEVAVKLVRGGFDRTSVLERFRTERQILASLDHPNIARLLDGGTSDDGIPYLVMELIEGAPIDLYCDAHSLSVSERLQLFRQVCSAVQYAHQRLVIHRDIKPSNVMVTEDGLPKLLDFGIAKILDPTGDAPTTMTQALTPEYASPEQIRGEAITTASDVYSLGVVLYQLLTGRSPYPSETHSPHEFARAICETEPGRPSSIVLKAETHPRNLSGSLSPEAISSTREGSPARLRRRLAGDLDNIALMSLRKEPSLRYASVEQFGEDIRRHLEGLPVIASKGSWKYRAKKFITRHKVGVAAAAAVFLALATGIGATLREAHIARQQAELAKTERTRAEKRFDDVRSLANSLIFEIHDSIQDLPGATPARKLLLDRAVEYLDKLAQDSEGDVDLQRELAWGYQRLAVVQGSPTEANLGDRAAAEASNRKATVLFEAVAKANPNDVIDQLNVAMGHRLLSFSSLFEESGRRDLEQAMAITERLMKTDASNPKVRSERSIEYQNLGFVHDSLGDHTQALAAFQKFLELRQDVLRTNPEYHGIHRSVGVASVLVGDEMARLGSRQQALQQYQTTIGIFEALLKDNVDLGVKRELAITWVKQGDVQLMEGNFTAARASFQQARSLLEPMAKADPENNMLQLDIAGEDYEEGRLLVSTGQYAAAELPLQRVIQAFQTLHTQARFMNDVGPSVTDFRIWLGQAQAGTRDFESALKSYQTAISELESPDPMQDETRCDLATAYTKIGDTQAAMGKFTDAAAAYNKALDAARVSFAFDHQDVPALYPAADAYAGLGDVSAALARKARDADQQARLWDAARDAYQKSLGLWQKIPNPSRISPEGFMSGSPQEVTQRLAGVPQK